MKPNILTRERLQTIEDAIENHGGSVSVRFLLWNHYLRQHIVDEAVELGFIEYDVIKGKVGRPSLIVRKVSKCHPTKLPPLHDSLEQYIGHRQWNFAFYYVLGECGKGLFSFKRLGYVAYQKAYASAVSKAGAKASASRLLKQPHIQAAIQWQFAYYRDQETDCSDYDPRTTDEIWNALLTLGSWRAKYAPFWVRLEFENRKRNRQTLRSC